MNIKSLKLKNYRNYGELSLDLAPGTNIFYGDNAQGKTNILESVYVCATSRSHKGTKDREIIRFGEEEAHIQMTVEKCGIPTRIDMHLKKGRSKGVAVNAVPIRRISELFGILNVIFFAPEDLNIIKNSPAERRRFMDMELCQLDKLYTHELVNYNKTILQRNKLLKEWEERPGDRDTLSVWDEQMIFYGEKLIKSRKSFIGELDGMIRRIHTNLTGGKEELSLSYLPNVEAERLRGELIRGRSRDLAARMTLTGPHRDDMGFQINGVDVRRFGSQGQQRTAALALKLAEIELVRRLIGDSPILLLDDVLSELDQERQTHLLNSIADVQTMITCTGLDGLIQHCFGIDRKFHVVHGTVLQEE